MTSLERAERDLHRAQQRFDDDHAAWLRALDNDYPSEIIAQYRHDRELAQAMLKRARELVEGLR